MMPLAEVYAIAPATFLAGVLILGLMVGSFLNVVIYRLPQMMHNTWRQECEEYLSAESEGLSGSEPDAATADKQAPQAEPFNLAKPNSRCPKCNAAIKPWQNIPVISYLLLKGACAQCGAKISARYPAVELVTGLASLLLVWQLGATPEAYFGLILLWCLIALTMIDIDHQLLPDSITIPLVWLGLLVNVFGVYTSLESAVIGAMVGYLSLWSIYWAFKLATGKEGMGFGDFKLLAALGAWMGWQMLPLVVILSSFVGAFLGIGGILLLGRDKAKPMPFGPYLAIAGLVAFLWGDVLLSQHLQIAQIAP